MSEDKRTMREEGPLSRRRFLGGVGGAAVALTVGGRGANLAPQSAGAEEIALAEAARSPQMARAAARRERAYQVRLKRRSPTATSRWSSMLERRRGPLPQPDRQLLQGAAPQRVRRGGPRRLPGLIKAAKSDDPADFAAVRTSGGRRLTNPHGRPGVRPPGDGRLGHHGAAGAGARQRRGGGRRWSSSTGWPSCATSTSSTSASQRRRGRGRGRPQRAIATSRARRSAARSRPQTLFRDPLPGCLERPLHLPVPLAPDARSARSTSTAGCRPSSPAPTT